MLTKGMRAATCLLVLPLGANTLTTTQSVSVTVQAAGKLSVSSSASLVRGTAPFSDFTVTLPISYKARTTSSGSAASTVQASSNFSPSGGPSVSSGDLTYSCTSANLGTACSGTQTISTSSQTSVVSIPANTCMGGTGCSSANPASMNLNFTVANSPTHQTGAFTVSLTFTISAI